MLTKPLPSHACKQERWTEDDAEFWKPSNATAAQADGAGAVRGRRYLPFGDGMRSCVGQSLAKMNYTATVALLLSHFTFRLADRVSPWCALMSNHDAWHYTVSPQHLVLLQSGDTVSLLLFKCMC